MNAGAILVADIGGTHARFGIAELSAGTRPLLSNRLDLDVQHFPDFAQALNHYARQVGWVTPPRAAAIAAAGPVIAGRVKLTNRDWSISEADLRQLGFAEVTLINDFAALAYSIQTLEPDDARSIGPVLRGAEASPVSVIGAGTGFGVACLVRHGTQAIPLITEGGHIAFAPTDDQQIRILQALKLEFKRVSVERILSGAGLESLFRIQQQIEGHEAEMLSAAQLTARAMEGEPQCRKTLSLFCSIYGSVAGDIALVHGARGGVIIAGGIAQKIEPFLLSSAFREQFENKGRLSHYVKSIPTKLLIDPDAALRGAIGFHVFTQESQRRIS
jgi:glucokinase